MANKFKKLFLFFVFLVVLFFPARVVYSGSVKDTAGPLIVVLGCEPLDQATPTLDMRRRVAAGVELFKKFPNAHCLFTGGQTTGPISEARMMSGLAVDQNMPRDRMYLEENSRSTVENARFCRDLILSLHLFFTRTYLVSNPEHLARARPLFQQYPEFKQVEIWPSRISRAERISEYKTYLAGHVNPHISHRLELLLKAK